MADRGLEHVGLDDVAAEAGIQRAALRHFVGNRDDLIRAAIIEITRIALIDVAPALSIADVVSMLFNQSRMESFDVVDRAWWELLPEALRSKNTRAVVKECYDRLLTLIANALRAEHPKAGQAQIADTAYAIACLAEHNYTFQRLEYPRARIKGVRDAALALADRLGKPSA